MTYEIMQHFTYGHLPEELQEISKPFCDLALFVDRNLRSSEEKQFALRKIMEAKDCAVRAKNRDVKSAIRETDLDQARSEFRRHTNITDGVPGQLSQSPVSVVKETT